MKFSTMMAVFAVALAVAATGCRYNKANGGAGEGANGWSRSCRCVSSGSLLS